MFGGTKGKFNGLDLLDDIQNGNKNRDTNTNGDDDRWSVTQDSRDDYYDEDYDDEDDGYDDDNSNRYDDRNRIGAGTNAPKGKFDAIYKGLLVVGGEAVISAVPPWGKNKGRKYQ